MALSSYGVLVARAVDRRREGSADTSPHFQLHLVDEHGTHYRIAVNVLSQQAPSELLYLAVDDFRHPLLDWLPTNGWTPLPSKPGAANLDYIRGNLFDPSTMRPMPPDVVGPDNDLPDRLDYYAQRAIADSESRVFAFGQRWGPEANVRDKTFGFLPGNGVHDIHMNQGNSDRFRNDDGVWQDGGLLIHFPTEPRWVALFLAFQSQAWHTDDTTGHAIPDTPSPVPGGRPVRIIAALVNPLGPGPEAETVTLLNASPAPVDLTGWRLADRMKRTCPTPAIELAAGGTLTVPLAADVQLGNRGGAITLLDRDGLKVDGVAYTTDDMPDEGWTVTF